MKLGLLTAPLPDLSLLEIADWAAAEKFEMLEVCCWPKSAGANRRYAGITHIEVEDLSKSKAKKLLAS